MDKLRVIDLRTPIAEVLNVCATSSEVVPMINRVERRLMRLKGGKWVGTTARLRICTTSAGCLTWPRMVETIEGFQICGAPGTLRNSWYEFSPQGPGGLSVGSGWCGELIDRGTMVTFDTPSNKTSKVAVTAALSLTEAADAKILLRGYNQLGVWIRSEYPAGSGTYIDGEYVAIESGVTHISVNLFSSITDVIKPITKGPVRLWQYDVPTKSVVKTLAYYEPTEEVPIYRASLLPGLTGGRCESNDERTLVTVMAKLRHVDVSDDNDFLVLGCEAAFVLGAQAVLKERRNLWEEAQQYWASAERELQNELSSYEGDGAIPTFKTEGRASWGASVQNAISLGWPITW